MEKYSKYDITNWFLQKEPMSPKKIQKMLYYTYAWGLVFFNDSATSLKNKVFDATFQGWVHGPVEPDIYSRYASYGYTDVPKRADINIEIEDDDVLDLLEQVYKIYGKFNGNQLESLTHQESPWLNSRVGLKPLDSGNVVIADRDMFNCYGTKE